MTFGSVCSGIEAVSVAWYPLGWRCAFVSEIEPFPCAVLEHHYPNVPNYGDMTRYQEWPDANIDVLVGGTPCQSFSVAGLRKGLDDPRGNLMLTFGAIAKRYRPCWLVWENVPGVLSSDGGRDFGTFLGMLAELGYGFAYRILDAQYVRVESHARAVPQRRRRVFVVGCLGDWRRAAAVLFERESLQGHTPPRREAGQGTPGAIGARTCRSMGVQDAAGGHLIPEQGAFIPEIVSQAMSAKWSKGSSGPAGDETANLVAHALRADGFDASEDGTGRGTPLVPIAFASNLGSHGGDVYEDGSSPTVRIGGTLGIPSPPAVAFTCKDDGADAGEIAPTLRSMNNLRPETRNGGGQVAVAFDTQQITSKAYHTRVGPEQPASTIAERSRMHVASHMAVRRLTPRECERLQGFPDDYTLIRYRNKPAADGPRYKALGNSMAVNVVSWIGQRIQLASEIQVADGAA